MKDLIHSAEQPIGPFYHFALTPGWATGDISAGIMAGADVPGEHIRLTIKVLDREGSPVTNAMLELWQADSEGRYNQPGSPFHGFGRLATNDDGICIFETLKPGKVAGPGGQMQAPHIAVTVYTPGLLMRVVTRVYFAGDPANAHDHVLGLVPEARRDTLLATAAKPGEWQFDLRLTGPGETVFFDI